MSETKAAAKGNGQRARMRKPATKEAGVALQRAISERPWLIVGAATGAGLALGLQSRRLVESQAVATVFATLGGIAMRAATNALVAWLQSQQRQRQA